MLADKDRLFTYVHGYQPRNLTADRLDALAAGGPSTLTAMVSGNHDYRGEW